MKKKIIILSSLLLTILLVSFYFTIYRKSTENESQKITYKSNSHSKVKRSDIQIFGDKKQYVLAPSSLIVGKKYAIDSEKRWAILPEKEQTFSKEHLQQKGEYWNLILYNLEEEGLPERKIDLYQAVRSYDKKSVPFELIGCYYLGGEHYFRLTIENLSEEQPTFKDVYLNLETEQIEEPSKDTKFTMDSDIYNTARATNFSEVIDPKGYMNPSNQIAKFTLDGRVQDVNINLYSLYPDIESKLIKEDWALYVRTDKVTPDEWFDTLLYWFATKGEDVLPVYGYNDDSSVSDTQIHNSQEAKAWLEQHPALQKH
ncbi:hypothetical protein HMPREF9383_2058 [Streptococcus sanguinis SK150]|jgi:hypothetical protein|uniref:Uncharacterized protein n=2 Tax=Streptococcus sanguinis TaxID=1305 RepID=F0IRG6_STRSA|nr:hypothetical protein [Streptococcus sanguinis]EGD35622.1 hypothetical protein HMPREF9383_2058 [Streptococcus sanguinis SK150]EGD39482.1 hypothetical protein HMPREF9384_0428 [Streptococcus sanguinis SK160]RSI42205.1 hypothetical protein D8875_02605 [Streptococcus sanguinis]